MMLPSGAQISDYICPKQNDRYINTHQLKLAAVMILTDLMPYHAAQVHHFKFRQHCSSFQRNSDNLYNAAFFSVLFGRVMADACVHLSPASSKYTLITVAPHDGTK